MAFHTSGLPTLAAVTADVWPSIANTLMVPWRRTATFGSRSTVKKTTSPPATPPTPDRLVTRQLAGSAAQTKQGDIPDFLREGVLTPTMRPDALSKSVRSTSIHAEISTTPVQSLVAASPFLRQPIPTHSPRALAGASHVGMRLFQPGHLTRPYSWIAPLRSQHQWRGFGTGGITRSMLADRESAANRMPSSPTAQNAFYQALLKANMPAIVVERYQTGRYATNEAADEAYQKAVSMLGSSGSGAGGAGLAGAGTGANAMSGLTPSQAQAVTQAVAAHVQGGNVAFAQGGQMASGGLKNSPIHVVVDDSRGATVFRWVKFILYFGLVTYLSAVVVTLLIESLNIFKRPSGVKSEVKPEQQKARFADVHGCDEAKDEVQELVEFLRAPDKFNTLGGKLPRGILLVGPPGTGKTLLARAIAGEAGVPFFYMSGSEFDEIYVGVGAKRVRELFAAAKAKAPAIVFIDELDAIGGRRSARDAAYIKQTLNQLLTELDGFEQNSGVVIIGATNFPEMLDKALTRPGRFDRHVVVGLPDVRGRLAILQHHSKKVKMGDNVDLQSIALTTSGLSGADLESIVNQAAVNASKLKANAVTQRNFDWARDKVLMGAEKKTMVITQEEKEMTAYHEAGHALVSYFSKVQPMSLYKVTILPRGQSLGHTAQLPAMDKHSWGVRDYLTRIDVCMGGKLAEEIVYGNELVTSGVSNDLQQATSIAWQMVAQFGMSEKAGPVNYEQNFKILSSETKSMVEAEVKKTLDDAYERTRKLLLSKRRELDLVAKALVQYETLDKTEVEKIMRGESLPDRVPIPPGSMVIPVTSNPIGDSLPGGLSPGGDETPQPPPAAVGNVAGQGVNPS